MHRRTLRHCGTRRSSFPHGPCEAQPAEQESGAAERRDRAEPAHLAQAERIKAAREQHRSGHEQMAARAHDRSWPPLIRQTHRKQRKRVVELVANAGLEGGKQVLREVRRMGNTVAAEEIVVECHPQVAEILRVHERDYLDGLEKRFHKKVELKASKSMQLDQYKVAGVTVKEKEPSKKARTGSRSRKRGGKSRSTRRKTESPHDQTVP